MSRECFKCLVKMYAPIKTDAFPWTILSHKYSVHMQLNINAVYILFFIKTMYFVLNGPVHSQRKMLILNVSARSSLSTHFICFLYNIINRMLLATCQCYFVCWTGGLSITLVQTEIPQQQLDGLLWNFVHYIRDAQGMHLTLAIP